MTDYCIINTEKRIFVQKLEEYGFRCIKTAASSDVSGPICRHADVLYLKADEATMYVSECQKDNIIVLEQLGYTIKTVKLKPGYRTECKLNMVVCNDIVLCNPKTCLETGGFAENRQIITTNQGYTKCSTAVAGNGFITEDESIFHALESAGKHVLFIEKGYTNLDGYDYGFIGGASAYIEKHNTLLFFGDITMHPDYNKIKDFCGITGVKIDFIKNIRLTDIGGVIFV